MELFIYSPAKLFNILSLKMIFVNPKYDHDRTKWIIKHAHDTDILFKQDLIPRAFIFQPTSLWWKDRNQFRGFS